MFDYLGHLWKIQNKNLHLTNYYVAKYTCGTGSKYSQDSSAKGGYVVVHIPLMHTAIKKTQQRVHVPWKATGTVH